MKKKILHIDMDGVIACFASGYAKFDADTALGEYILEGETEEDLKRRQNRVNEVVLSNTDFFQSLDLIDGALEAVTELNDLFDIYFLSTPMDEVSHSFTGKKEWLNKVFGVDMVKKKLILTHRKDLIYGDYLVDDRTKNGAGEFRGELILFGSEKYPNWEETLKYLRTKV